jgi:hypothetical protein
MKPVELYARVRHACHVEGLSQREAARRFGIDPKTVAKMLRHAVPPGYRRSKPPVRPKLDAFTAAIDAILEADRSAPPKLRDDGEDAEGELGGRRRGVDRGALAGQHLEPDAPPGGLPHQVDRAAEVAAAPVELPDDRRGALARRLGVGGEPGPVLAPARSAVLVEPPGRNAGGKRRVALQVDRLPVVGA